MFDAIGNIFSVGLSLWYIILPPLLLYIFKVLWMYHVNGKYAMKLNWVLLEIIPSREIEKSPLPMELIYAGFAGVIKGYTTNESWVIGMFPVAFSLEMASIEGRVHMYIKTQTGYRNLVEAHFYAQYPDIELVEVPDYVNEVPRSVPNKDWDLWGCDFILTKHDLYPIRTYKHFEESVTGKMVDPLAGLIETMGKIGPGQHIWFQIIATPMNEEWLPTRQGVIDEFLGRVEEEGQSIFVRFFQDIGDVFANLGRGLMGSEITWSAAEKAEAKEEQPVEFRLTPGQKKVLEALEQNIGKQMFNVRMRFILVGRRETFSKPFVSAFIGGIKQFNDYNLNGFKPEDISKTEALYLMVEPRMRYRQRRIFRRYIDRDGTPDATKFMLSSEELATIFHIPDMQVVAPSMSRVVAKRGGAPTNLPVQDLE